MEMLREIIWELTKVKVDSIIMEWKCFGMNQESQGATSTICSNEQYYRGKKIDKIKISKKCMQRQSQKKHTDKNAHEADMQILQKPATKTMPGIWEDVYGMQENWPL